ncbi:LOW QUALITY PROTEIN: Secreted RxLR effector peptide protein [Phytophthora palmivora]|uniref:RxLR effector protein n=1 Tax=Phytophthora palmivora TaxID=4796 RepID=A0A2P4Y1I4_9STRA|nr:LOW QUALITY PROTEIN: Secreted RxLR effector peptide protein [Phytophthora palmivora]
MRLSQFVALAAAGLIAITNVVTGLNTKLTVDYMRSITDERNTTITKRFLRTNAVRGEEDEERTIKIYGFVLKIDGIESLKTKTISDTTFKLLELDQAGDDLFRNPQVKTWVSYMTSLDKKHPKTAMVSTLVARYGDEPLAKMLEAAKKIEGMDDIATKLQFAQMKSWLNSGKSADEVFQLLNLDVGVEKLLSNQNLEVWVRYMHMFNKRYPEHQTTMVDTMSNYYGDAVLSIMLETAKKSRNTQKLATELQVMHFNQWLMDGAKPAQIKAMLEQTKLTSETTPASEAIHRAYKMFYELHQ